MILPKGNNYIYYLHKSFRAKTSAKRLKSSVNSEILVYIF